MDLIIEIRRTYNSCTGKTSTSPKTAWRTESITRSKLKSTGLPDVTSRRWEALWQRVASWKSLLARPPRMKFHCLGWRRLCVDDISAILHRHQLVVDSFIPALIARPCGGLLPLASTPCLLLEIILVEGPLAARITAA